MFGRQKVAILVAEFLSAAILSSVVLAMIGRTSFPFFAAVAAGITVGLMSYLFSAHANPAVTLGLWTMRKVQTAQAIVMIAAQMLGGLVAWQLSEYLLNNPLKEIAGTSFDWRILLAEALGAMVLGLGVAVAASRNYAPANSAFVVGMSLSVGILLASIAANGLLNPAVAIGVQSWSWAYALGPVLGTVIGTGLYGIAFVEPTPRVAVPAPAAARRSTRSTARKTAKKPATRRRA